jgi:hypothetical protein
MLVNHFVRNVLYVVEALDRDHLNLNLLNEVLRQEVMD